MNASDETHTPTRMAQVYEPTPSHLLGVALLRNMRSLRKMKVILRGYGIRMNTMQRQVARSNARDVTVTRGTSRPPQPPREIITQAGPRGVLLSWSLPVGFNSDIQRWRVYTDDENTIYAEIMDRGTRQHFVESTAGSTPPVRNFFVSSLNALGIESQRVQVQASAAVEAGAPTMPSAPPGYSQGGAGGGNRNTGYRGGEFSN